MRWQALVIAIGMVGSATPVSAADDGVCATGMVCASKPETIAAALQAAGYKAKADIDSTGDPSITSAASGYTFDVMFYGCEKHFKCDSLQFRTSWSNDPIHTAALANEWNRTKRFAQASVNDRREFVVSYDVSTIGGINKANFADTIEWWTSMLSELKDFWKAHPSAPETPGNAT